jgi:hypothetical protein
MMSVVFRNRLQITAAVAVMAVITSYLPAVEGEFIGDDAFNIVMNAALRDLPLSGIHRIFLGETATSVFLPLTDLSLWIDLQVFGDDPTGYHLHNLALYALACFLVWKMALALAAFSCQEREMAHTFAAITTVLFAVHPAHVENVAWISGRKDLLAGVMLLVAWLAWAHALAANRLRIGPLLVSYAAYAAALMSKSSVLPWPAAAALMAFASLRTWMPPGRALLITAAAVVPFAAMCLAMVKANLGIPIEPRIVVPDDLHPAPWTWGVIERALLILGHHIRIMIWPIDPQVSHQVYGNVLNPVALALAIGAMVAALWGAWLAAFKRSAAGLGCVLLVVMVIPYMQLIPFYTISMVAERFVFLPSLGLALALAGVTVRLRGRRVIAVPAVLALCGLVLTAARVPDWKDWNTLIRRNADSAPTFYNPVFQFTDNSLKSGADPVTLRPRVERIASEPARRIARAYMDAFRLVTDAYRGGSFPAAVDAAARLDQMAVAELEIADPLDLTYGYFLIRFRSLTVNMYGNLLRLRPRDGRVHYLIGEIYLHEGETKLAVRHLTAALTSRSLPSADRDKAKALYQAAIAALEAKQAGGR